MVVVGFLLAFVGGMLALGAGVSGNDRLFYPTAAAMALGFFLLSRSV